MIRFSLCSKIEIASRARVFSLLSALALAAAATLAAPTQAAATLVTWTMSGSDTFFKAFPFDGQTDTFSGSFVFDTSVPFPGPDPYSAVDITVSGPLGAGTYTSASGEPLLLRFPPAFIIPAFTFAFDLGLDEPNLDVIGPNLIFGADFRAADGVDWPDQNSEFSSVVFRRVPEPPSLALLGGALALLPLARRLSRRGHPA